MAAQTTSLVSVWTINFGYARGNSVPQNNNTPVYHGQRTGGRLLIAPLIKERRDLIDTIRVETGFVRHFCLGLFADLLVVHQTAEQQLKIVCQSSRSASLTGFAHSVAYSSAMS